MLALANDSHVIAYFIFLKIGKGVAKFVVCCSRDSRLSVNKFNNIRARMLDYTYFHMALRLL